MSLGLNIGSANAGAAPLGDPSGAAIVWVNFDRMERTHVTGDARALPFRDGVFGVVHCSHLIEHIPRGDVRLFLADVRRVMTPNAYAFFSGPDVARARSVGSRKWTEIGAHGGVWFSGWEHEWACDPRKLRKLLKESGFVAYWALTEIQGHPPKTHGWPIDFESRFVAKRDDSPWPRFYEPTIRSAVLFE